MKKRILLIGLAVGLALAFAAAWRRPHTVTGFAMGSVLTQTHWANAIERPGINAKAVERGVKALEEALRTAAEPPALALEITQASGGAFNPWLGALARLWNIDSKDGGPPYVPDQAEIDEALRAHALDLGAYGKGAACDTALEILGSRAAVVNLGGNILTYGRKPWNRPFKIALRDPKGGPNEIVGQFTLRGTRFISTSGSYEKYFEQGGKRYHHIFDPDTGRPACREPGLISVTVITKTRENAGALGDLLSTACFVLGYRASLDLLRQYDCGALFFYENGTVRAAGPHDFTLTNPNYQWDEAAR